MKNSQQKLEQRIRSARKQKGINQTELSNLLGKSLLTIQKYESGEIEVSIAMINQIAKVLDSTATFIIGYRADERQITSLADIMEFLFKLDKMKGLSYQINVKKPPHHNEWQCSISINGKDKSADFKADMCLFLEEFANYREEYQAGQISKEKYHLLQDKDLAYYSAVSLEEKEQ